MSNILLYSFRRCPYAMRARMALYYANQTVELREVVLKNKPQQMLEASAKATVPVLVLRSGEVVDESLDIMLFALNAADPDQWLDNRDVQLALIAKCDESFKSWLDKYKYAERHPEFDQAFYRAKCCEFISELETILTRRGYLNKCKMSLADAAIFPFVRQFAHVDRQWFYQGEYASVQRWLDQLIDSEIFKAVMEKHPAWAAGDTPLLFPSQNSCL